MVSKKSGKTILKNLEKRIWKNMEKIWKNVGPKNSSKKRLVNNAEKKLKKAKIHRSQTILMHPSILVT